LNQFEVSAKENIRVEDAFQMIAREAAKREKEDDMYREIINLISRYFPTSVSLKTQAPPPKAKGCCQK
jgi:hypothetical protein